MGKLWGDEFGIFEEEGWAPPVQKTRGEKVEVRKGPLPAVPDTGWRPPENFPDLSSSKVISIDTETFDPDLEEMGPGTRRGAYIAGVSIATDDGFKGYYPIAHEGAGLLNMPKDAVFSWLSTQLSRPGQIKLGANILYDLDMLAEAGVRVEGPIEDVQIAEPLLDENALTYSLERISHDYLGRGKLEDELTKWGMRAFGSAKAIKKNLYRTSPILVGPYAEEDAVLPLEIRKHQLAAMERQTGLLDLYRLECRLIPMLLAMRRHGVRIDLARAEQLRDTLTQRRDAAVAEVKRLTGKNIEPWDANSIARAFDAAGIHYLRNSRGPSFTKAWLDNHPSPIAKAIMAARVADKFRGTFIEGYIFGYHINGRLHCQFHQLRGDGYGTVSGRFSSSDPNLQNIPTRDEELGPLMRSLFLPDEGHLWYARDWSQIEYRLIVHYASLLNLPGAADAVAKYRTDPKTDFHRVVAEMAKLDRKDAKNLNFGIAYGEGAPKIANDLGRELEEAKGIIQQYDRGAPFVRRLAKKCSETVERKGEIRTLLNRRRRFPFWECGRFLTAKERAEMEKKDPDYFKVMRDPDAARKKWGRIRRAWSHKSLNALIQGSAADIMKKAMVEIWESGICRVIPALLTVHDELGNSKPPGKEADEAAAHLHSIMEGTVQLAIPLRADGGEGQNWAEAK